MNLFVWLLFIAAGASDQLDAVSGIISAFYNRIIGTAGFQYRSIITAPFVICISAKDCCMVNVEILLIIDRISRNQFQAHNIHRFFRNNALRICTPAAFRRCSRCIICTFKSNAVRLCRYFCSSYIFKCYNSFWGHRSHFFITGCPGNFPAACSFYFQCFFAQPLYVFITDLFKVL